MTRLDIDPADLVKWQMLGIQDRMLKALGDALSYGVEADAKVVKTEGGGMAIEVPDERA